MRVVALPAEGFILCICCISSALASKVLTGAEEPGWWYALHVSQAVSSTTANVTNTTTTLTTTSTSPPSNAVHLRKDAGCTTVRLEGRGAAQDGSHSGWCRIIVDEKTIAENGAGCGNGLCFVVLNRFRRVPRASFCSASIDSSYARYVALKLQALTPGTVVLVVLWKQGAATLIPELRKAIYDLGGLEGYRIEKEEGYALIGIVGSGDGGAYAEDRAKDANISAVAQSRCIPHAPESHRRRRGTTTAPIAVSQGQLAQASTTASSTATQLATTTSVVSTTATAPSGTTTTTALALSASSSTTSTAAPSASISLNSTSANSSGNTTVAPANTTSVTTAPSGNHTASGNLTQNASQGLQDSQQLNSSTTNSISTSTTVSGQTTTTSTTAAAQNTSSGAVSVSNTSMSVSKELVDDTVRPQAEGSGELQPTVSSESYQSDSAQGVGEQDEELPDDPALNDLPPIQEDDGGLSGVATEPSLVRRVLVSGGAEVTEDMEMPDLPPIIRSLGTPLAATASTSEIHIRSAHAVREPHERITSLPRL